MHPDLDPKTAPFLHVVKIAQRVRGLCEELELPAFCKTSGQAGLHVLVPLGGQCTHEQSKVFGELLAKVVCEDEPEIATTARLTADRGGRVYVDFLQNGHGKTLVAPFSVRPVPGAPVSTPLTWGEVTAKLNPRKFTIATVISRMTKKKKDPLAEVLNLRPDLRAALEKLGARLRS